MSPRARSPHLDRVCAQCGTTFRARFQAQPTRFCSRSCGAASRQKNYIRKPVIDRLMARVIEDENGCWIWNGARNRHGYGQITLSAEEGHRLAHRVTYEHFVTEIPTDLELDHLCVTPSCVNPWHLEPVTHLVNVQRAEATGKRLASWRAGRARRASAA